MNDKKWLRLESWNVLFIYFIACGIYYKFVLHLLILQIRISLLVVWWDLSIPKYIRRGIPQWNSFSISKLQWLEKLSKKCFPAHKFSIACLFPKDPVFSVEQNILRTYIYSRKTLFRWSPEWTQNPQNLIFNIEWR